MTFSWGIVDRITGVKVRGEAYATEAEAIARAAAINAEFLADMVPRMSAKARARWSHLDGVYFVPLSPATQADWALVEFSR